MLFVELLLYIENFVAMMMIIPLMGVARIIGDTLDQDVRKCEREIRALQTTLEHLNARNAAYRESFQKIDLKGERRPTPRHRISSHATFIFFPLLCYVMCVGGDAEVLAQLEERTKLSKDSLFRKKKELQRLITDFDEDYRRYEQVRGTVSIYV